jgi:hypothetical protein
MEPTHGITMGDRARMHRELGNQYIVDYLSQNDEEVLPDEDHEFVARLGFLAAHDLDTSGHDYYAKAKDLESIDRLSLKLQSDSQATLDDQELDFLYELTRPIEDFSFSFNEGPADKMVRKMRRKREGVDNERIKTRVVEAVRQQSAVSFETCKKAITSISETRRSWWRFLNFPNDSGLQSVRYGVEQALHRMELKQLNFLKSPFEEQVRDEELKEALERKIQAWEENGVFDWCADYVSKNGGNFILTVTPNVMLQPEEIRCLALSLGRDLGKETYFDRRLNERYSAEELSGQQDDSEQVRFSLIATRTTKSFDTIAGHRAVIESCIRRGLNVYIPSALEAILYRRTTIKTNEHQPSFIHIPHINLPSRYDDGYSPLVPLTSGTGRTGPSAVATDVECRATYAIR